MQHASSVKPRSHPLFSRAIRVDIRSRTSHAGVKRGERGQPRASCRAEDRRSLDKSDSSCSSPRSEEGLADELRCGQRVKIIDLAADGTSRVHPSRRKAHPVVSLCLHRLPGLPLNEAAQHNRNTSQEASAISPGELSRRPMSQSGCLLCLPGRASGRLETGRQLPSARSAVDEYRSGPDLDCSSEGWLSAVVARYLPQ